MGEEVFSADGRRLAIDRWADKYTARFDQELANGWHDLAHRVEVGIDTLSWRELAFGPGEDFQRRCLERPLKDWAERYVQPVADDATRELAETLHGGAGSLGGTLPGGFRADGTLERGDVIRGLTLPTGVLLAGGAVSAAVATTTKLLIFTTVVVHWPLLIGGLIVGGAMAIFGGSRLARLKDDLLGRFRDRLLPQVRAGILGEGFQHQGKRVPSLREQLDRQVRETAAAAKASVST